jgi:hypothetical protein
MPESAFLVVQGDGQQRQHDGQEAEPGHLRSHDAQDHSDPALERRAVVGEGLGRVVRRADGLRTSIVRVRTA